MLQKESVKQNVTKNVPEQELYSWKDMSVPFFQMSYFVIFRDKFIKPFGHIIIKIKRSFHGYHS